MGTMKKEAKPDAASDPRKKQFKENGRFAKGNNARSVYPSKKPKRISAAEIIDLASDQLAREFAGTKTEPIFAYGFSPIKEIMRLYAKEHAKKRPNFDKMVSLLKALLPYVYPTMKSVEFENTGDLPTLTIVLADDDEPEDKGKGKK